MRSAKRITTYWQGYDYDELNPQPMPSVYTIGNELVKVGDAISHLSKTLVRIYTPFLKMSLTTLIEKAEAEANAIAFDAEADNPDMIMADPAPADLPIDLPIDLPVDASAESALSGGVCGLASGGMRVSTRIAGETRGRRPDDWPGREGENESRRKGWR